jgi:L-arabinokinase
MCAGFAAFRTVDDLPFIARRSQRDPADVRRLLQLPAGVPLVFTSFGGYGLRRLDAATLPAGRPFVVVTTESARFGSSGSRPGAGVVQLDEDRDVYGRGLRYADVIAAVDVVLTKPGYGIIADCIANGTALIYTSRGHFVEYDLLVREMPRYLRCGFLPQDDLLSGRWDAAMDDVLRQAPPPERPAVNGAERAAARLHAML